jgi:hypothetical protein
MLRLLQGGVKQCALAGGASGTSGAGGGNAALPLGSANYKSSYHLKMNWIE